MDHLTKKEIIKKSDLFSGMPEEFIEKIIKASKYKKISKDELLIQEGSLADHIYIVIQGRFVVFKSAEEMVKKTAELVILSSFDVVGEMSFLDELPRSANVRAIEDSIVIEIPSEKLRQSAPPSFYRKIAKKLCNYIRLGNNKMIENLKQELEFNKKLADMGRLITYVLLLIAFYNLSVNLFAILAKTEYVSLFASTGLIFIFTVALTIMIKQMDYPLQSYGLTLKNWKKNVKEAVFYTFLAILLFTAVKWMIFRLILDQPNVSLINLQAPIPFEKTAPTDFYTWLSIDMIVYAIFSIFQEFITRGVLQSSLQRFLQSKNNKIMANLITSGVFSAMHIHLNSKFALIVFIPSLFWGWLYTKQESLVGPIVSHILMGWWAINFLGVIKALT